MTRPLALTTLLILLAFGWFMGDPALKTTIANQTCTQFLAAPASLATARGHIALWWQGGSRELLADNCATYPHKPMAIYLGWPHYLRQNG